MRTFRERFFPPGEAESSGVQKRREEAELRYWRESPTERPDVDPPEVRSAKMREAAVFLEKLERFREFFYAARFIVEIGAGQGWASCLLKQKRPEARIVATDLSPDAVASVRKWQRVFDVELDEAFASPSDCLRFADGSVDLLFCFASAHHFGNHAGTFREIGRVLAPGGVALYLHEPTCTRIFHPLAQARVLRKRPQVPEDVLVYDRTLAAARAAGLDAQVCFAPTTTNRSPIGTVYYSVLSRVPPLQRLLPCSADFIFRCAR